MSDVFISYARSTEREARAIAEGLRAIGYGVWRDDEIPAHRSFAEVIEERLTQAKAVVVIWSAEAIGSEWVRSEADRARAERKLVQLRVDATKLPMPFDQLQCADLAGWGGETDNPGWRRVTASVAELVGIAAAPPAPSAIKRSICVLPFVNISGDPEQEYFSDGVSEDIITDLSKVSALSVTARNTAFTFKGKSVDVPTIARQIGVSHVLEGSVRKAGNRVRITAQLIDASRGDHLWAERFDRDLTDIFAVQDEISQAIVAALKVKLAPEEKQAIEKRGTDSVEAYDLYWMARDYVVAGNIGDPRREETIIRLCDRATEIDPAYARAWALKSFAQSSLSLDRGRGDDDGLAAAQKAEALDPTLGAPHAVRARVWHHRGRTREALSELDRALALDPEGVEVTHAASIIYYRERRFEEASRLFEQRVAATANDVSSAGMLLSCRAALGDGDGTRAAARTTLERAEKALAADRNNGNAMGWGVMALLVLGERTRAQQWIDRATLIDPGNLQMRYNLACAVCLQTGDADAALALLGPVLAEDAGLLVRTAASDPDLDSLRQDSRFQALLANAQARVAAGSGETKASRG